MVQIHQLFLFIKNKIKDPGATCPRGLHIRGISHERQFIMCPPPDRIFTTFETVVESCWLPLSQLTYTSNFG